MPAQHAHVVPALRLRVVVPQLDVVVAAAGDESAQRRARLARRLGAGQLARRQAGGPGHGVGAEAVRGEELVRERVVVEGDDGDGAVRGRGGEVAAGLGRGPGEQVHRGCVQGELVDALPLGVLLAPDEDAAVVGGGGEDGAVFGVGPGDAPYGSVVAVGEEGRLVGCFV